MKNLFKLILPVFLLLFLGSCTKEPKLHKIKYEIEFINTPEGSPSESHTFAAICVPNYNDKLPYINPGMVNTGSVWVYEYLELKDKDKILFYLMMSNATNYYYKLNVYVDGVLKSTKRVKYLDGINCEISEESGLSVNGKNSIEFTFKD